MNNYNKYNDEELARYKTIEAMIRLNQLKIGDVITEQLEKDLRVVTGPKLYPKTIATIHFDKIGQPHSIDAAVEVK